VHGTAAWINGIIASTETIQYCHLLSVIMKSYTTTVKLICKFTSHKQAECIIAGLTAATRLNDLGFDVLVLEASNRVGGRMLTVHVSFTVTCAFLES
jgi:Flavin containing amine oxidoreductase